jgi:hypothetical protein
LHEFVNQRLSIQTALICADSAFVSSLGAQGPNPATAFCALFAAKLAELSAGFSEAKQTIIF